LGEVRITGRRHPMAVKIKIVTGKDFVEVTPDGAINLTTSKQLLTAIAKAETQPVDYELLIDFRDTESALSIFDIYQLAAELVLYGDTFHRKVALLVVPGINFDQARFFETCSHNRGFSVNAFIDYENALRWLLSPGLPEDDVPPNKADAGNDK